MIDAPYGARIVVTRDVNVCLWRSQLSLATLKELLILFFVTHTKNSGSTAASASIMLEYRTQEKALVTR